MSLFFTPFTLHSRTRRQFTPSHIQHHLTCNTIVMASEYEQARVANIKRNEEFLKNIGLGDLQRDIRQSADTAAAASQSSSRASSGKSAQRKRQRGEAARTSGEEGTQAPRRSRRLQSPAAMGAKGDTTAVEEETFLYLKDAQGECSASVCTISFRFCCDFLSLLCHMCV